MSAPAPPLRDAPAVSIAPSVKMKVSVPVWPLRLTGRVPVMVKVSPAAPPMTASILLALWLAVFPLPVMVIAASISAFRLNVTALKSMVSVPSPTFSITVSVPQLSSKMYVSSPNPPAKVSSPGPPLMMLSPSSPVRLSSPLPPTMFSICDTPPLMWVAVPASRSTVIGVVYRP